MRKYLSTLPYMRNGYRTLDYLLSIFRRIIKWSLYFSIAMIILMVLGIIFRIQVPDFVFFIFFILLLLNNFIALYFGIWNARLTSRQRYELFEKVASFPRNKRIATIKKFIMMSFVSAIMSGVAIIILTINNYILVIVNSAYVSADRFLKYSDFPISYRAMHLLIGGQISNSLMVILPILIYIYMFVNTYQKEVRVYNTTLVEQWIESRFFKDKSIDGLIQDRDTDGLSNIRIGIDSKFRNDVIMNAATRALNVVFFGLIGVGKSASIAKPFNINDTENFIHYIRQYAAYIKSKRIEVAAMGLPQEEADFLLDNLYEEWFTKGIGKNLTNGFYVNEPSGDLIRDALDILKRSGLPKDVVWHVNPPQPDTDAINIFDAKPEIASALAADLFRNFSEGDGGNGNPFFANSEEAHTRSATLLLIITAQVMGAPINKRLKGNAPTLSDFNDILLSNDYIFARLEVLKIIAQREERLFKKVDDEYNELYKKEYDDWIKAGGVDFRFDANQSLRLRKLYYTHRDLENKLKIMKDTILYFTSNLFTNSQTGETFFNFDANINGLKNVINSLSKSPYVRRVFFSQSTKNVDVLLKMGGVILVNSAKAELGDANSRMVGQVAEIIMQSGAYRRLPNLSPLFPYMNDEKNTILMARDQGFLDQNRKFRTPALHLYQNYEQAVATIGADRADALFQSYRNAFVFQQSSPQSVEYIANRVGDKYVLQQNDQYAQEDMMAGNDNNSRRVSEQIIEEPQLKQSDMAKLEQFEYAGVMVVDDEVSDMMFVTSVPNFLMPMFSDENFKPPFNMDDPEDREAYKIWSEMVEKCYIENGKRDSLTESDFTPNEWAKIMEIHEPNILSNNEEKKTVAPEYAPQIKRENTAKEDISSDSESVKTIPESPIELVEEEPQSSTNEIKKQSDFERPVIKAEEKGTVAQNIIVEDDSDGLEELW
ncbi:TraM recognition domain-containing protein [Streptococcus sp. DTU_2020_1000888_1_SI_GRL_NUU_041A]|uniref:TraM recognition domain-containing protein n=1 Tax=Streptococcus sp. DTU_2020_1000888_1_SI_GRL_NUU_041A TaxID=3077723 RepID=UPI0028EE1BDC|nr:TraM recognition domain-containing protein [Streptococcus sp. DTU_2020_1000888_1_SI_GRL_NUU_041A]WNU96054.1 TraM recognition domain-containing protein [Streptococcus sp. DTU_2020_1000888_1_SI_GRL_NUU_041A]